jgi:uncharacterized protein YoxC
MHTDTQVVTLVFTIVTGIGVLLQAGVLLGMFLGLRETQKKIHALTEQIQEHVLPLMHNSRGLMEDLTPKVKIIASNLVDVSSTLKAQTENVKTVVEDVTERTRKQTARADGMVTGALNTLAHAGAAVERGISAPLRQVSSVLNGLRAGMDTLRVKETGIVKPVAPRVSTTLRTPLSTPLATASTPTPTSPLRSVVPAADTPRPGIPASDSSLQEAVNRIVNEDVRPATITETTPEEASAAAARFVRDRAAATSSDRR